MITRSYYPSYSRFLSTEYIERGPVINGEDYVHHSIHQTIQWLDVDAAPLLSVGIQTIGIAWGVIGETRLFYFLEEALARGLLSPILFISARSGCITIIVDNTSNFAKSDKFKYGWEDIVGVPEDPYWWNVSIKALGDGDFKAELMPAIDEKYVQNISDFWHLGVRRYQSFPPQSLE